MRTYARGPLCLTENNEIIISIWTFTELQVAFPNASSAQIKHVWSYAFTHLRGSV
jgi:hypothetical protein